MTYKYTQHQYIKVLKKDRVKLKISLLKEIDKRMDAEKDNERWGEKSIFYENKGWMEALHWAYDQIK
jgi:hypothetical protein|tara:strand:+ start:289 stop:489 length:201 start_codon:yes stop_codon:yes gene_type:complete